MDVRGTIAAIAEAMERAGGSSYARKLEEFSVKMESEELCIVFCGHFSAGKSTLVNRLCGSRLLPSGPVPTSANAVRIRNGEPSARIWRKRSTAEGMTRTGEKIPLHRLEAACKDGDRIESVDITYPLPLLGEHTVLVDTPGIDSTDSAHQAAAESALHWADAVFYVMDYNYVQSEINFAFIKRLKDWGKPCYLLVNQIDKHREEELPFSAYRSGVEAAFREWGIRPDGILYLSLKDERHAENEWNKLPGLIGELAERSGELRVWNAGHTVLRLIREFMKELEEESRGLKHEEDGGAAWTVGEPEGGTEALQEELAEAARRMEELEKLADNRTALWKKEIASIGENANLTPAATRDLAGHYLASRRPGFKAGLFAGASRTSAERERRLAAFHGDLTEKVKAHLYWQAADYIRSQAVELGLASPGLTEALEAFRPHMTPEWLAGQVHAGAEYSGAYTLTYTRQIADEIRQGCRREAFAILELLEGLLRSRSEEEMKELRRKQEAWSVQLAACRNRERLERETWELKARLEGMADVIISAVSLRLPDPSRIPVPAAAAGSAAGSEGEGARLSIGRYGAPEGGLSAPGGLPVRGGGGDHGATIRGMLQPWARKLDDAARVLEGISGMDSAVRSMRSRALKLEENRFTVALFGAFSSGKSSLANALLGEQLLPVSPNPTTAAIHIVLPPTPDCPHGTVKVHMKPAEAIREDLLYSLRALGQEPPIHGKEAWEPLLQAIRALHPEAVPTAGKPHMAFLKALERGWSASLPKLGQVITAGLDEFGVYATDETRSCFVSHIELYDSTPLAAKGAALVDTPGADSINARHTGVAFNYIKNADAVLFVTYYNHAFSQADREFLMQLGRIKDTLELDKMFFLVNAADLASGQEELEEVVGHVEENLLRHGIRSPRIFPVSSRMALTAKLEGDREGLERAGFLRFERELSHFAAEELASVAVHGAKLELEQAARRLERLQEEARADAADREDKARRLNGAEHAAAELPALRLRSEDRADLRKELEELLYYVKQRTEHRFGEWFRLAYNPAVLREDVGDLLTGFRAAWRDLLRMSGLHLSQEVLTAALRIEQYANRQAERKWNSAGVELAGLLPGYEHGPFERESFRTPNVSETLNAPDPEEKRVLGFYRNGRTFFEGEGKDKLRRMLETWLAAPIASYIGEQLELLYAACERQQEEALNRLARQAADSFHSYCEGLRSVWSSSAEAGRLEEASGRLKKLLQDTL